MPFTSELAQELAPDVLRRFLRYVKIDTQSRRDRTSCPSSEGQLALGELLVRELEDAGLAEVKHDANGYVTATLPANSGAAATIGLIAHMDTSPDAPGAGVAPIVHERYDGTAIELPNNGTRLDPEAMPELGHAIGHTIVTSSGDTLLGADDKAGVAEIVAAVAYLSANPQLPRPTIRVCFTPDEEIGEGATLFDIEAFGAECAYTMDGSSLGEIDDETFNAIEAIVDVRGVDVHPGQATGKLVSALRIAANIVAALPADRLTPDTTADREGFIHPYELTGSAARAEIRYVLRDHDFARLEQHLELLKTAVDQAAKAEPRATVRLDTKIQYRNMREYIDPQITEAAKDAIRAEGIEPRSHAIRGGTDGSRLSEMGLPTPNIFTGGHEFHSPREWASVHEMAAATATIVRLAEVWAKRG
jgi:tripeptide aminopeptidase